MRVAAIMSSAPATIPRARPTVLITPSGLRRLIMKASWSMYESPMP